MIARAKGALMEWMPISKRIITVRFYLEYNTDGGKSIMLQQVMRWIRKE